MWVKIGTIALNFLLDKVWGVIYKLGLIIVDYATDLIIKFRRDKKLEDNKKKLEDAIKSGDKDAIAQQGENSLNNR